MILMVMVMVVPKEIARRLIARHDHNATACFEYFNLCSIERAQLLRRQHLRGRSNRRSASDEIEDTIDERKNWIDLVGDKKNRSLRAMALFVDKPNDLSLAAWVERQEGLITKEDARTAEKRLGNPKALLLAT